MGTRRLVEIFLDLVQIDATSDHEKAVADYVRGFLGPLGVGVEEDAAGEIRGGDSGNLICTLGDGGDLLLTAHMDTARPTAELQPVVTADRIKSDGRTILGADNRAGVAAILYTMERLQHEAATPANVTAALTICEETDLTGSRALEVTERIGAAFVLDSSLRPGRFVNQAYGACRWRAEIQGRAAHAGVAPEDGINALHLASRVVSDLSLGRLDAETVSNVGVMGGGESVNVVPDQAWVEGEVRSLSEARIQSVVAGIEKRFADVAGAGGGKFRFETFWDFRPYSLPADALVCSRLGRVLSDLGLEPEARTSAGGSDANALNAKGLPAVNVGIGAQNPHANDEFILIEDLAAAADIAIGLIRS